MVGVAKPTREIKERKKIVYERSTFAASVSTPVASKPKPLGYRYSGLLVTVSRKHRETRVTASRGHNSTFLVRSQENSLVCIIGAFSGATIIIESTAYSLLAASQSCSDLYPTLGSMNLGPVTAILTSHKHSPLRQQSCDSLSSPRP